MTCVTYSNGLYYTVVYTQVAIEGIKMAEMELRLEVSMTTLIVMADHVILY